MAIDFELLFESSITPKLVLGLDYNIVAVNNSFIELLGMERQDVIGKKIFDIPNLIGSSSSKNDLLASMDISMREKKTHNMKIEMKYKIGAGESFWQPSNSPIFDYAGELKYIIYQIEDITNFIQIQKQISSAEMANLELKEVQNFLESILENLPNMVFVKEARELKFVKLNKAGEELLGYKESELIGKNDYDFFPASQADFFTQKDRAVLSSGEILDIPEEPIHTRFNGDRILHTKKVPLYDQSGKSLFLVGISEDITEKVNLVEARLAQKSAEDMAFKKAKFLDVAAHELRTPITSLSLLLQFAVRQLEKGKPLTQNILARLLSPADQLKKLVTELLDMSRLERGIVELSPERFDINLLISNCIQDFKLQAPLRRILYKHLEKPIVTLLDPVRINQVLSNLLDNAIKYTKEGDIIISVEEKESTIKISVNDSGPGIPLSEQQSLFSAFTRGNSESTSKASGLGLGLSVCKGIVELHGGTMGVHSIEGQGSSFYFEIPKDQNGHSQENKHT